MKLLTVTLLATLLTTPTFAADLPREHVIHAPAIGKAPLSVHNLFQDNMVLQRGKPVSIWGWADPDKDITVTFAGQTKTTKSNKDRTWKITLDAMDASSKGQDLSVSAAAAAVSASPPKSERRRITLRNVLIGDVWILGGQSNMEEPIRHVEFGRLEIATANFPNIRILTIPAQNGPEPKVGFPRLHEWSDWSSRHFRKGDWDICTPETIKEVSAIGYVFARRLQMGTGIPIGIIDTSRGGTTVETWTPVDVLKKIDVAEVKDLLKKWDTKIAEWDPQKDLEQRIQHFNNWVKDLEKHGEKVPEGRKPPSDLRPGPTVD